MIEHVGRHGVRTELNNSEEGKARSPFGAHVALDPTGHRPRGRSSSPRSLRSRAAGISLVARSAAGWSRRSSCSGSSPAPLALAADLDCAAGQAETQAAALRAPMRRRLAPLQPRPRARFVCCCRRPAAALRVRGEDAAAALAGRHRRRWSPRAWRTAPPRSALLSGDRNAVDLLLTASGSAPPARRRSGGEHRGRSPPGRRRAHRFAHGHCADPARPRSSPRGACAGGSLRAPAWGAGADAVCRTGAAARRFGLTLRGSGGAIAPYVVARRHWPFGSGGLRATPSRQRPISTIPNRAHNDTVTGVTALGRRAGPALAHDLRAWRPEDWPAGLAAALLVTACDARRSIAVDGASPGALAAPPGHRKWPQTARCGCWARCRDFKTVRIHHMRPVRTHIDVAVTRRPRRDRRSARTVIRRRHWFQMAPETAQSRPSRPPPRSAQAPNTAAAACRSWRLEPDAASASSST